MALPTVVLVGPTKSWIPEIVEKAKKFKLGAGIDKDTDIGPICYK